MSNSCGGGDACIPAEIEVALKEYIRRHRHRDFFDDAGDPHSCLLEDLGGTRCPDGACHYNADGKPTGPNYKSKKPIAPAV
jgi:hypothetical protein